jgi:hypothetical protein
MSRIEQLPTIGLEVRFVLTESEARALDGLTGYSIDEFLKFFYQNMGRHYLEPHEAGLRSLFKSVRSTIPGILERVDKAREVFNV